MLKINNQQTNIFGGAYSVYRRLLSKFHRIKEHYWAKKDSRVVNKSEKVLFVDLGANLGQGYGWFKEYFNSTNIEFELFEPNPNCVEQLLLMDDIRAGKVTLHDCGVGVANGFVEFYGLDDSQGGKFSQGGSTVREHASGWYETSSSTAITVRIIDFSEYLRRKAKEYKKIIVKMDIEGAEIEVLEHLISEGTVYHIDFLYVEFHSQYQRACQAVATKNREKKIMRRLCDSPKLKVRIWH